MRTEKYIAQHQRLPDSGKQIIGCIENNNIIVYQAFNSQIAEYAVKHQKFGGAHYSFTRMSWIKPGFLWMMYRAGWGTKENQEHILAITLPIIHFKTILAQATISSYKDYLFPTHEAWKSELSRTEVRLQWDPDHDPFGTKQERKAIQIGMKGDILKTFCTEWIINIEDISEFVKDEYNKVLNKEIEEVIVPYEEVLEINNPTIESRIGVVSENKL